MFSPFAWVLQQIRDASLAGIGDAIEILQNGGVTDTQDAIKRALSLSSAPVPQVEMKSVEEETVPARRAARNGRSTETQSR